MSIFKSDDLWSCVQALMQGQATAYTGKHKEAWNEVIISIQAAVVRKTYHLTPEQKQMSDSDLLNEALVFSLISPFSEKKLLEIFIGRKSDNENRSNLINDRGDLASSTAFSTANFQTHLRTHINKQK